MKDINCFGVPDRINRAVSIAVKILNNLEDIRAAESTRRLGIITLFAYLGSFQPEADVPPRFLEETH